MEILPFQKIVLELESRIRRGIYPSGSALPPRVKLMEEFKVARVTLDRAIQELIRRGRCVSRRGSGTYVQDVDCGRYQIAHIGWNFAKHYPQEFNVTNLGEEVPRRSEWQKLLEYDGIIWSSPSVEHLEVIDALSGKLPQVVVNRISDSVPYVSIDYRAAYATITEERMTSCPDCQIFFLRSCKHTLAVDYRLRGFVEACAAQEKFYQVLEMPENFRDKYRLLQERFKVDVARPMVVVSDSLNHTGAFMRWVTDHQDEFTWGKNLFYNDFDNDFSENIWGVKVTSFLQDHDAIVLRGAETLLTMLKEGKTGGSGVLMFPVRRHGDT